MSRADVRPFPNRLRRRDVLALGIGALVVLAVPLAASRRARAVRRRIPVMGTVAEIVVVSSDEGTAHAAIGAAFAELRRIECTMTSHSDDSEIGRANLFAARDGVAVSPETAHVVAEAIRWAEASDGAFDPCLGRAGRLWDVEHRNEPPDEALVRPFAARSLWRRLDVDLFRGAPALRFSDPAASVDLGGIAKGYAVDAAARVLRACGVRDAVVNVGGDLVALGRSATGDPWRVGVQSPDDPGAVVAEIEAEDTAVATSGDYVRYFEWRGRRYSHLLDPATAAPRVTRMHSLTVQAASCMDADAAATALYGTSGAVAARVLAARAPAARVVHSIVGAAG